MEERKHLLDYLGQVMLCYGFTVLVINCFTYLFGNDAQDYSALFSLGDQGIPFSISMQFLLLSVLITLLRVLFFTDYFIKEMRIWKRASIMLGCILALISAFILIFHWFPADDMIAWILFLCCFAISFIGSALIMQYKENAENKRMADALKKLKQKEHSL